MRAALQEARAAAEAKAVTLGGQLGRANDAVAKLTAQLSPIKQTLQVRGPGGQGRYQVAGTFALQAACNPGKAAACKHSLVTRCHA